MNTLIRNTTNRLTSKRGGYESLLQPDATETRFYQELAHTVEGHEPSVQMTRSFKYKSERAKQRQIFLRTYKLTAGSRLKKQSDSRDGLKLVALKLKTAAVSFLSFLRARSSLESCSCGPALDVYTPTRVSRFC